MCSRHASALRIVSSLVAGLSLTTCLPSEPSGSNRIVFGLLFEQPLRVPLGGVVKPLIRVTADGEALMHPRYHFETSNASVVRAVRAPAGDSVTLPPATPSATSLAGVTRGTVTVRVVFPTATGTPDTTFTAQVVVTSVVVDVDTSPLTRIGQTRSVSARAFGVNSLPVSSATTFAWSSSDTMVARVSNQGVVTARNDGTTLIRAELDGVTGSAAVRVEQAAARVVVLPERDTLRTVKSQTDFISVAFDDAGREIIGAKPRWTSTQPGVVSVDTAGRVTAEGGGTALIIARVGTAADTATVIVAQVVRYLFLAPGQDTLTAIRDTGRVIAIARDSNNYSIPDPRVAWSTSDGTIATVDQTGLVTAVNNGLVLITGASASVSGIAVVLVRQEAFKALIAEDSVGLVGAGDTVRLNVQTVDRNDFPVSEGAYSLHSASGCIASVDTAALVTALHDGLTRIVATPANGSRSDTALVSVTGAPMLDLIAFETERGVEVMGTGASCERTLVLANTYSYYQYFYMTEPTWSPSGDRLAFTQYYYDYYNCYYGCYDVFIARADGSQVVNLTNRGQWDGNPAWSPDGTRLAFSSDRAGASGIHLMNADGSNVVRLTFEGHNPTWSPDGARIAFDSNNEIYVVNADGTGVVRLTNDIHTDHQPAWSPNSAQLAFERNYDVWLMNTDGTAARNLTTGPETDHQPAWSPDGSQIVFVRNNDLYVMNADGTGLHPLTTTPEYEFNPSWSQPTPAPARLDARAVTGPRPWGRTRPEH